MESNISKDNLEKHLGEMADWFKAVIFDGSANILASKNASKTDEKELRYLFHNPASF
jgi:hypothetical protein